MAGHRMINRSNPFHKGSPLFYSLAIHVKEPLRLSIMPGRTTAQAVSRRPLTADARVRAQASLCGICGGQSGTGTGFSPKSFGVLCQYYFTLVLRSFMYHLGDKQSAR
jgi:hypothetical protein